LNVAEMARSMTCSADVAYNQTLLLLQVRSKFIVGLIGNVVRTISESTLRRAGLEQGWVNAFGGVYHVVCNQPTGSTQPCIESNSSFKWPRLTNVRVYKLLYLLTYLIGWG